MKDDHKRLFNFLGRGGAFDESNSVAYAILPDDNIAKTLFFIDAGEQMVKPMMDTINSYKGKGIKKVSVFITHTHMDHIGGLSTLQFFVQYMLNGVFFEVVVHERLKEKVLKYFEVAGNDLEKFEIKTISETKEYKLHSNFMMTSYETHHRPGEFASGLLVRDNAHCYYYSGDSNSIPDKVLDILEKGAIREFYQDITVRPNVSVHAYYETFIRKYKKYFEKTKLFFYHQDKFTLDSLDKYGVRITEFDSQVALEAVKNALVCNVDLPGTEVHMNVDKTAAYVILEGGGPVIRYLFDCRYGKWEFIGYNKSTVLLKSTHILKSVLRVSDCLTKLGLDMGSRFGIDIRSDVSTGLNPMSMISVELNEIEIAVQGFYGMDVEGMRILPTKSSVYRPAKLGEPLEYYGEAGYDYGMFESERLSAIIFRAFDAAGVELDYEKNKVHAYSVSTDKKELVYYIGDMNVLFADKEEITLENVVLVENMPFTVKLKKAVWGCVDVDRERIGKPNFKLS